MRTRSAAVSCACNMDVTVSSLIRSDPLSRGFETQDTLQAQSSCFQRQVLVISCSSRLFLTRFVFSTAPPHPYLALLRTDVCSAGVNVSETRSVIGSCITSGTRQDPRQSVLNPGGDSELLEGFWATHARFCPNFLEGWPAAGRRKIRTLYSGLGPKPVEVRTY